MCVCVCVLGEEEEERGGEGAEEEFPGRGLLIVLTSMGGEPACHWPGGCLTGESRHRTNLHITYVHTHTL